MSRRRAFLLYYAMRSPVFDRVTLPTLNRVGWFLRPVPLAGPDCLLIVYPVHVRCRTICRTLTVCSYKP